MFNIRWRWNATRALAIPRWRSGGKVAPQLQRMAAEDLLALVFELLDHCLQLGIGKSSEVRKRFHHIPSVDGWVVAIQAGAGRRFNLNLRFALGRRIPALA